MNVLKLLKSKINLICIKYSERRFEDDDLPIFYVGGSQTLPPPLSPEEEIELLKKLENK